MNTEKNREIVRRLYEEAINKIAIWLCTSTWLHRIAPRLAGERGECLPV